MAGQVGAVGDWTGLGSRTTATPARFLYTILEARFGGEVCECPKRMRAVNPLPKVLGLGISGFLKGLGNLSRRMRRPNLAGPHQS